MQIIHKPEIMGRLIKVKLNGDKLFFGKELKTQVYKSLKKGLMQGLLHNSKMMIIGEWKTNLLINVK